MPYEPGDEKNMRYEIVDGIRYHMQPSPVVSHQVLNTTLYTALHSSCQLDGIVMIAPMDVHLGKGNVVQPDLILIRNDNASVTVRKWIYGVPDLLVEILAPSGGAHDKIRKKELYARFCVPEYWIVDPVHDTIDLFKLDESGQHYRLERTYGRGDKLLSGRLPCIQLDLERVFAAIDRFRDTE
ncbi:Uma2 family endonuclease [Paenibacillus koleovorans]|uniref:Uma2 family endonuclease n=1 Tax=Paenibacillus koleovorans TaxID=121608 RepID=UPI00248299EB|nr:Uma2 family endonuclease [Paenibacillus koleovorans]